MSNKFIESIKDIAYGNGNIFESSLYRFPEINTRKISNQLNLKEKGHEDGSVDFPSSDSSSMSHKEREVVESIRKIRASAINNFESELESYNARIVSVRDEKEQISLLIGKSINEIISISNNWENKLENLRVRVYEHQEKVKRFQIDNNIKGPPREPKDLFFTISLVLFVALVETAMNGYFFADANPMGYVGGMSLAVVITFINIIFSSILGHFSRNINVNRFILKLWGYTLILAFVCFSLIFNFSVAHFRDALEMESWEPALIKAVVTLKEYPFDLRSYSSWLIMGIGVAVSFTSFWKWYSFSDPYPGYAILWDESENAVTDYADGYDEAHDQLNSHFEKSSNELKNEVAKRRDNMKSAEDAVVAKDTLIRNFEIFLEGCSESVNILLRVYRDANIKSRRQPAPKYFNAEYNFPSFDIKSIGRMDYEIPKDKESEIEVIENAVNDGVEQLLKIREKALSAFPTVRQIKFENSTNFNQLLKK